MRSLLTVVGVVGLFLGVVYFGGGVLGLWEKEDVVPAASKPAVALTETGGKPVTRPRAAKKVPRKQRAARNARTRVRLVAADMAVARKAVLRLSDMAGGGWRRVPVSADHGPGCAGNHADLSRLTVTGTASSGFKGGPAQIQSRVKLFANARAAALYFGATFNGRVLRCIREGVKGEFQRAGLRPRVVYGRFQKAPRIGSRTSIYVVGYVLTLADGSERSYPLDVLTFRVGRAVGAVSFGFVPSEDGARPCSCEVYEARLVARRLSAA